MIQRLWKTVAGSGWVPTLSLCFCLAAVGAEVEVESIAPPSPRPSTGLSVEAIPSPGESGKAVLRVTKSEARLLSREFTRAQANDARKFRQDQLAALKELRASQNARDREWRANEDQRRHEFSGTKPKAPQIRQYISERKDRYQAFQRMLKDEYADRDREAQVRRKAFEDDQAAKKREFDETLQRGERPSDSLWPAGSR